MGSNVNQETQYLKFYNKTYNDAFSDLEKTVKKPYEAFFTIEDATRNSMDAVEEKGFSFGGFGDFQERNSFNESIPEDDITIGWDYSIKYKEKGKRIVIGKSTSKTIRKELDEALTDVTKGLMDAAYKAINKAAADLFNNYAAHVGGDSKALFATNHPIKRTDGSWTGSKTWSNLKTTSYTLNHDNIVEALIDFDSQLDLDGSFGGVEPKYLIYPIGLAGQANTALGSIYNSSNANQQVNQTDQLIPIKWKELANYSTRSQSAWYLSSGKEDNGLIIKFLTRPGVEIWENKDNKTIVSDCLFDFAVGYKKPRNVLRCQGY